MLRPKPVEERPMFATADLIDGHAAGIIVGLTG
jgi:hypothetical protein